LKNQRSSYENQNQYPAYAVKSDNGKPNQYPAYALKSDDSNERPKRTNIPPMP